MAYQYAPPNITYRLDAPGGAIRFLKLAAAGTYPSLAAEAERMRWLASHLPTPEVVDVGRFGGGEWLLTRGLPGHDATHPSGQRDVEWLVQALAQTLRRLHEVPVGHCPFDGRLEAALAHVRDRVGRGDVVPERDFHEEFASLSAAEALAELEAARPPDEDLVVCHGDFCLPNVVFQDGRLSGVLDLGELGVADRWWDLAVATWSLTWNLGPGHEALFLEAYGVEMDAARMRYYRLLYDLVS